MVSTFLGALQCMTCSLCADARDSIAKVAYGRVFGWIVCKINELLAENVDPEVELREIGEFCLHCSFICSQMHVPQP